MHTNLNQWAIAENLDVVSANTYFATQQHLRPNEMWLTGELARSLKNTNYLITETNAQGIGWDSRAQYPFYPGQLRLAIYTNLAAGANMVEYWHWHSLHYGQETYWKGVLSHDLEPNRAYAEVSRVAGELKKLGPELANLKKDNKVAILFSADSANALRYMPFSDNVSYMTALRQMYDALCALNVEPDFVQAEERNLRRYKVLLVPPLYSASDAVLQGISEYVHNGGQMLMEFKSGFTNEYSTVRDIMAPGLLRQAAGFHYQEFTSLVKPEKLIPDAYNVGEQNLGSVWQEFLIPDTAGILVGGGNFGEVEEKDWSTQAAVRDSVVHDLYGDGIILFRVKNGLIDSSAAWHTGMQPTQSIGTPNAIWTWMCANKSALASMPI